MLQYTFRFYVSALESKIASSLLASLSNWIDFLGFEFICVCVCSGITFLPALMLLHINYKNLSLSLPLCVRI